MRMRTPNTHPNPPPPQTHTHTQHGVRGANVCLFGPQHPLLAGHGTRSQLRAVSLGAIYHAQVGDWVLMLDRWMVLPIAYEVLLDVPLRLVPTGHIYRPYPRSLVVVVACACSTRTPNTPSSPPPGLPTATRMCSVGEQQSALGLSQRMPQLCAAGGGFAFFGLAATTD